MGPRLQEFFRLRVWGRIAMQQKEQNYPNLGWTHSFWQSEFSHYEYTKAEWMCLEHHTLDFGASSKRWVPSSLMKGREMKRETGRWGEGGRRRRAATKAIDRWSSPTHSDTCTILRAWEHVESPLLNQLRGRERNQIQIWAEKSNQMLDPHSGHSLESA